MTLRQGPKHRMRLCQGGRGARVRGEGLEPGVKLCKGSLEGSGCGVFREFRQLLFREFRQMLVARAPVVMPRQHNQG